MVSKILYGCAEEKTKKARMEEQKPEILKSESDELKLRRSDEMKGKFNININFLWDWSLHN